jgi:hypothetical protein
MLLHLAMSFQSDVGVESPGYEENLMCQSIYRNTCVKKICEKF